MCKAKQKISGCFRLLTAPETVCFAIPFLVQVHLCFVSNLDLITCDCIGSNRTKGETWKNPGLKDCIGLTESVALLERVRSKFHTRQ